MKLHSLAWVLYGNDTRAWMLAGTILALSFIALLIARRVLTLRVARRLARAETNGRVFALEVLNRTHPLFLLLGAATTASFALSLSPGAREGIRVLMTTGLIVQMAFWGNDLVGFLGKRYAQRQEGGKATIVAVSFLGRLVLWCVLALLLLDTYGVQITTLVATLGVGGIAVALAAQSVLGDLLAAISIYLDKPFVIGDFIIFDDFLGTVEYVGLRSTQIQSLGGERIVMSNSDLLQCRIRNYKPMAERRAVFEINVAYGLSYDALASVPDILREAIAAQPDARLDRAHFKKYTESSLVFEAVYYVLNPDYAVYMDVQQGINLHVYRKFEDNGIAFAHPLRLVSYKDAAR